VSEWGRHQQQFTEGPIIPAKRISFVLLLNVYPLPYTTRIWGGSRFSQTNTHHRLLENSREVYIWFISVKGQRVFSGPWEQWPEVFWHDYKPSIVDSQQGGNSVGGEKTRPFLILRKAYRERWRTGTKIQSQVNLQRQYEVWQERWSRIKLLMLWVWIPAPAAEFQKNVCPHLCEPLNLLCTDFYYVKRNMLV